ncbi:MAG: altronate dehydratase [Alphaproteobacteria bacterium]|nr:altronate dehydratase [Alphaproteobacteria bacterium]
MSDATGHTGLSHFQVSPLDTVAVALRDLSAGERLAHKDQILALTSPIPRGHKLALAPTKAGETVVRYGWPMGVAVCDIAPGEHVHTHNVRTALTAGSAWLYAPHAASAQPAPSMPERRFDGYRRKDGRVGIRSEIWIIATVGCVAQTARRIASEAARRHAGAVDGIHAITHPFGCSQLGDDLIDTRSILAALAGHPNAGGVLIIGLGCESNQIDALLAAAPGLDPARVRALKAQSDGDELETGLALAAELAGAASHDRRSPCPVKALKIGVKCGGSDGFSGLTADPLAGRMTDMVTAAGGTSLITEIPEIFGAEHLLLNRAVSRDIFDAGADLVDRFKRYFTDNNQPVHENPSPGNIAGGITTLEEKSLGAVQKAGQAALTSVIGYGEQAHTPGLTLLEAPGNDAVSSTALAAAGAHLIVFTTGRGTPLGFPVPTLKIASNSDLARRKGHWIDFDAGTLLDGETLDAASVRLFELLLATASGAKTRNEINEEREIAIWKRGVTL